MAGGVATGVAHFPQPGGGGLPGMVSYDGAALSQPVAPGLRRTWSSSGSSRFESATVPPSITIEEPLMARVQAFIMPTYPI